MVFYWVSEKRGGEWKLVRRSQKFRYDTSRETLLKVETLASVVVAAIYDLATVDKFGV